MTMILSCKKLYFCDDIHSRQGKSYLFIQTLLFGVNIVSIQVWFWFPKHLKHKKYKNGISQR